MYTRTSSPLSLFPHFSKHATLHKVKSLKLLKGDNKELLIINGASHCDLYDDGNDKEISWDEIDAFLRGNLK